MRIVHFCAGLAENNGMANTARQFVAEELAAGHDSSLTCNLADITNEKVGKEGQTHFAKIDVVEIHGAWLPAVHRAAKRAKAIGAKLIVRPAGSYDPVRLRFHGWKKRLMAPWERAMLRRADVVQATCPQEAEWVREYLGKRKSEKGKVKKCGGPEIEITDLKRFFELGVESRGRSRKEGGPLHVLYLGRRHPLKGVAYLEEAVAELNGEAELRIESTLFGEAKEAAWEWCDVLCLPTLSENFGRVVAEALEHGKRVVVTDGAPVWSDLTSAQGLYLRDYVAASDEGRVRLLADALRHLIGFRLKPDRTISLVTVCRNAEKTLGLTLESVWRQKTGGIGLEYIVVDGASTDGTVDVIKGFADEVKGKREKGRGEDGGTFVFRWVSEKDRGLYDAINKGIRMATGDVVGICHADDVLADDETIARIAAAFFDHQPSVRPPDAVYADVRFVRGGESVEALRAAKTVRYCTGRFFRNWMFRFATFPAHPSTFVRRECFEKHGLYSLDYPICADFEMMLRLFRTHGIRTRYLPVCTHVMRLGGVSTGGLRANVQINREDLRALRTNGVWSCLPLIYLKYFAKIWGFVGRRGG